ncbi:MAG TPA: phosphatidylserine decarboxylase family protein [Gemmatimonadaceae bacterium]|nr:phosphatidylserine decarboxylase family protein [Gemmatimonadaceae bacterium]
MRFAREGLAFIALAVAVVLISVAVAARHHSGWLWLLVACLVVLALWVAYFFRDPERAGERGDALVVSPADGRIVMITEVDEPSFLQARSLRISIFMNVFNVHVNRYPVDGVVEYLHYNQGKFLHAASEKASLENEQMSVGIQSGSRRILVRQIAGLIARRIVNYARVGDRCAQGTRMGIIRFGSRVDVYLDPSAQPRVSVGDRAVAGTTVLAELCT